MNCLILADAERAPHLFQFNGPGEREQLEKWIRTRGWVVPRDLLEFWTLTSGGQILETERFLRPLALPNGEEEVAAVTAWCYKRGMPKGLVVFHEGLGFTAVRPDGSYVSLDSDVQVRGEYRDLDDWYVNTLREEYAGRYRLPPLPE